MFLTILMNIPNLISGRNDTLNHEEGGESGDIGVLLRERAAEHLADGHQSQHRFGHLVSASYQIYNFWSLPTNNSGRHCVSLIPHELHHELRHLFGSQYQYSHLVQNIWFGRTFLISRNAMREKITRTGTGRVILIS